MTYYLEVLLVEPNGHCFYLLRLYSTSAEGLHICKNRCNFLMRRLIALKFGTNKEHIKVNSGTEFGMTLKSIQCVRSSDSHKQ